MEECVAVETKKKGVDIQSRKRGKQLVGRKMKGKRRCVLKK